LRPLLFMDTCLMGTGFMGPGTPLL
jgi:hypothetical protein